ncbi:19S proteasome regulatory subunit [Schizosaccharomyces japonicus yFS275]|uniref:19S proteasome regulatory subunit n=1 Tax=Schizosaccharomyces japonicus (strain yFS275 / FY16936) TaxID=402676 RepID=B6K683_SCHJY|nr:19S proteasome regulatory subunit [Schizosaccharomyces japonicus yFS275]EEB09037.1 19S proteasome regulatory subunit [Schizosaccharomyces japonicus yFS275]
MDTVFGRSRQNENQTRRLGLISLKAGKLNRKPGTKVLQADHRKGVLYFQLESDELLHFYWKPRSATSTQVEDDFIIFPDEAEFVRIPQCTTGRVYALKFKSSSQIHFYWLQDTNTEKDEHDVSLINQLIADPVTVARTINARNQSDSHASHVFDDSSSTNQLLQLFGATGRGDSLQDFNWDVLSPTAEHQGILPHLSFGGSESGAAASTRHEAPTEESASNRAMDEETLRENLEEGRPLIDLVNELPSMITTTSAEYVSFPIDDQLWRVISHPRVCEKLFPHYPREDLLQKGPDNLPQDPEFLKAIAALVDAVTLPEASALIAKCGLSLDEILDENGAERFLRALETKLVAEGVITIPDVEDAVMHET